MEQPSGSLERVSLKVDSGIRLTAEVVAIVWKMQVFGLSALLSWEEQMMVSPEQVMNTLGQVGVCLIFVGVVITGIRLALGDVLGPAPLAADEKRKEPRARNGDRCQQRSKNQPRYPSEVGRQPITRVITATRQREPYKPLAPSPKSSNDDSAALEGALLASVVALEMSQMANNTDSYSGTADTSSTPDVSSSTPDTSTSSDFSSGFGGESGGGGASGSW